MKWTIEELREIDPRYVKIKLTEAREKYSAFNQPSAEHLNEDTIFIVKSIRGHQLDLEVEELDYGQSVGIELVKEIVKCKPVAKTEKEYNSTCYCGSPGDDLVFAFYCSNSRCRNYKE